MAQQQYDIMGALQAGVKPAEIKKYLQDKGRQEELGQLAQQQFATPARSNEDFSRAMSPAASGLTNNGTTQPAGITGMETTQDIQNTAAAPKMSTPLPILAAEQVAPDLVTALNTPEIPISDANVATIGFTSEMPKILTRTQQSIKAHAADPLGRLSEKMIEGTASSFVSPLAGMVEGGARAAGMNGVADAAGKVRQGSEDFASYMNEAVPTQTFGDAKNPAQYGLAAFDSIATNATQLVGAGAVARGSAILAKAAIASKGAAVVGGITGAYGLNTAIETGSIYNDQPDEKKNFGKAAVTGAIAAVLDTAGQAFVIGKSGLGKYLLDIEKETALKAVGKEGASLLNKTMQGAKNVATGYTFEATQEGAQTLIERTGAYKDNLRPEYQSEDPVVMYGNVRRAILAGKNPLTDDAFRELKESAQAGGAMGGGLSAGGHVLSSVMDKQSIAALASSQTDPVTRNELATSALTAMAEGPLKDQAAAYFKDRIDTAQDMNTDGDLFMKPILPGDVDPAPTGKEKPAASKESLQAQPVQEDPNVQETVPQKSESAEDQKQNVSAVGMETASDTQGEIAGAQSISTTGAGEDQKGIVLPAVSPEIAAQAKNIQTLIDQIGDTTDPALKAVVVKAKESLASLQESPPSEPAPSPAETKAEAATPVKTVEVGSEAPRLDTAPTAGMYSGLGELKTQGQQAQGKGDVLPVPGEDGKGGFRKIEKKIAPASRPLVMAKNDTVPFKTEVNAKTARTTRGMTKTHDVVSHEGGFALAPTVTNQKGADNGQVQGAKAEEVKDSDTAKPSPVMPTPQERQDLVAQIKEGTIRATDLEQEQDGQLTMWKHNGKVHAYTEGPISEGSLIKALEDNAPKPGKPGAKDGINSVPPPDTFLKDHVEVVVVGDKKKAAHGMDQLHSLNDDDLSALLDEAQKEVYGEPVKEDPRIAEAAAKAAKLGVEGMGDILKGLSEALGNRGSFSFDTAHEDRYSKAKPYFEAGFKKFSEAGKTIKEYLSYLYTTLNSLGLEVDPARAYIKRYIEEGKPQEKTKTPEDSFKERFPDKPWLWTKGVFDANGEIERDSKLDEEQTREQDELIARLIADPEKMMQDYLNIAHPVDDKPGNRSMIEIMETQPVVVNPDEARDLSSKYRDNPAYYSGATHPMASAIAKMIGAQALTIEDPRGKNQVLALSGGGGSGKGSSMNYQEHLDAIQKGAQIIFDGTMAKRSKLDELIKSSKAAEKTLVIAHVHRSIEGAVNGIVSRKWNGAKAIDGEIVPGRDVPEYAAAEAHYHAGTVFIDAMEEYSVNGKAPHVEWKPIYNPEIGDAHEVSLAEMKELVQSKIDSHTFPGFQAKIKSLYAENNADPRVNPYIEGGDYYGTLKTRKTHPIGRDKPGIRGEDQEEQGMGVGNLSGDVQEHQQEQSGTEPDQVTTETTPTTELSNDAWLEANRARIPASEKVTINANGFEIPMSALAALKKIDADISKYEQLKECLG